MPSTPAGTVYTFGPFRLEVEERRLLRDGQVVVLAGKAFDLLQALVEGAGALHKQQALIDRLWPDVVVEPNNLQYNVSLVRRALQDAPGIEIQTVRGQGYRLLVEPGVSGAPAHSVAERAAAPLQRVHFCKARDGVRLGYALAGEGKPLIKAANWLNHLEFDWDSPVWRHWFELLTRSHRLIRYDSRGTGLSDWQPPTVCFEDLVEDLAAVFDAAGVERAPILGISQGASVAAAYAARHPERVSALILVGGSARGWRVKTSAKVTAHFEALMVLMQNGWGREHATFRQIFTGGFLPNGTSEQMDWYNELQRRTASPENAVRILSALGDFDVRAELPRVKAPTIVMHARGDRVKPMKDGIELASHIAGARFVPLESDNHLLLQDEPAWDRFTRELDAFLRETGV